MTVMAAAAASGQIHIMRYLKFTEVGDAFHLSLGSCWVAGGFPRFSV